MSAKQPSKETIALTEKKMDMSLDDIVRMSKTGMNKQQRVSNKSRGAFNGNQDRSLKVRQYMNSRSTLRQEVFARNRSNFQGKSFPLPAVPGRRTVTTLHNRPVNNRNAGNFYKPRLGGQSKYQGNAFARGNSLKQQHPQRQHQHQYQHQPQQRQHQNQHALPRGETMPDKKPKTLDSLFANMKEQRMRSFNARPSNGSGSGNARVGFAYNQPRQPWLRGRFGSYNN